MMKRTTSIYGLAISFALVGLFAQQARAQDDLQTMLKSNLQDGTKLINGYVDPFMKTLATGLDNGWYNTAKPHKVAGLDLTLTVNAVMAPKSANFYNVNDLKLTNVQLAASQPAGISNGNVPTIFGPDIGAVYQYKSDPSVTYTGPGGLDLKKSIGMNALPVPMVQLGFGLPKGFDLKVRFFPSTKIGDNGTAQLFGLGVMHDVKQYIPGIKLLPFDLSAFVGYTHLKLDYGFDTTHPDQHGSFEVNSTTIQGVISKKISVLTVYGGAGYNIAKSSLSMLGKYDIDGDGVYGDKSKGEVDPLQSKFAASGPRVTAGFRLKLAIFTLHADYTLQKYSTLTAGFGISIR
jgi:hypothetical protein